MNGEEIFKNGIIDRCAQEAVAEFSNKGWRKCSPNALMLVIYLVEKSRSRRLQKALTRPLWGLITVLASGLVWLIVCNIFNIGGG